MVAAMRAFLPAEGTGVSCFLMLHETPNAPQISIVRGNKSWSPLQSPWPFEKRGCKVPGDRPSEKKGPQPTCSGTSRSGSGACGSVAIHVITPGMTVPSRGGNAATPVGAFVAWVMQGDRLDDKNGLKKPQNQ